MGIGVSVFLIAVGAILTFALNASVSGIDLATVGVILMVVGGIGLAVTLLVFGNAGRSRRGVVTDEYVEDVTPVTRRRVIDEP